MKVFVVAELSSLFEHPVSVMAHSTDANAIMPIKLIDRFVLCFISLAFHYLFSYIFANPITELLGLYSRKVRRRLDLKFCKLQGYGIENTGNRLETPFILRDALCFLDPTGLLQKFSSI